MTHVTMHNAATRSNKHSKATHSTLTPMINKRSASTGIKRQLGLGLFSMLFWVALLGSLLLVGMQVVPVVSEYLAIKKAVNIAKLEGEPNAIRNSFDQQSKANYVDNFSGRDLVVESVNGITTVEFAYRREIPLAGPVSLLFKFSGKELVR